MSATDTTPTRTPPKRKARQLAGLLRDERPDYHYLKAVFRALRDELGVPVDHQPKRLARVPTDDEIRRFYDTVWQANKTADAVLAKTLLYTGVRVAELVAIGVDDIDFDSCRIHINSTRGRHRDVPFPRAFRDTLAGHADGMRARGATHLFESSWKKPYSTRGVRALLARYAQQAGLDHTMAPQQLRHYLLARLSNHDDTQPAYDAIITKFPI